MQANKALPRKECEYNQLSIRALEKLLQQGKRKSKWKLRLTDISKSWTRFCFVTRICASLSLRSTSSSLHSSLSKMETASRTKTKNSSWCKSMVTTPGRPLQHKIKDLLSTRTLMVCLFSSLHLKGRKRAITKGWKTSSSLWKTQASSLPRPNPITALSICNKSRYKSKTTTARLLLMKTMRLKKCDPLSIKRLIR